MVHQPPRKTLLHFADKCYPIIQQQSQNLLLSWPYNKLYFSEVSSDIVVFIRWTLAVVSDLTFMDGIGALYEMDCQICLYETAFLSLFGMTLALAAEKEEQHFFRIADPNLIEDAC